MNRAISKERLVEVSTKALTAALAAIWLVSIFGYIEVALTKEDAPHFADGKHAAVKESREISKLVSDAEEAFTVFKNPEKVPHYDTLLDKDIFSLVKEKMPLPPPGTISTIDKPFKVLSVEPASFELIYNGYLVLANGEMVAQLNFGERTYLARRGETAEGWVLDDLNASSATLSSSDGEKVVLEFKKPMPTQQLIATILDLGSKETVSVQRGEIIGDGYLVLDIKDTYVVLSKGDMTISIPKEAKSPRE
ncbi:MAG: hypothetical protein HQ593_02560 [Candidatus Omnitrophica bacterium]|nr:hypothetical protein [Candidatus Omnitrophota bacterium]